MSTFSSLQQQKREQSAAPTPSFARPGHSFTPVSSSTTESQPHEVSTNSEQAARFGYSFDQIPIFPPAKKNTTGLPDTLKAGVEHLSGIPMDDVHVHYHSSKPAQVQALAYTQGTEIHVGPRQEEHLPHEAWHVVQQKQGRVAPTLQAKGVAINDDREFEKEADMMGGRAITGPWAGGPLKRVAATSSQVEARTSNASSNPLQRVTINGVKASNGAQASRINSSRFSEVKGILDGYDAAKITFPNPVALDNAVNALLRVANTVYIKGNPVAVQPHGKRANEHLNEAAVLQYFRYNASEITSGDIQSLPVGEGREKRNPRYGRINYSYKANKIQYWHAHDSGPMG